MKKTAMLALILATCGATANGADAVIEPPMSTIPAGVFAMGSGVSFAPPGYPVEQPIHQVKIASFQMAKYEVTVKQFRQFVEATGHKTEDLCWKLAANDWGMERAPGKWNDAAYAPSDYHPVMCVSWLSAKAYVQWLSEQTGKSYRLPSEAEWEYAARSGSSASYHFGDDVSQICRFGNVRDATGRAAISKITGKPGREALCDDGAGFTSVVGMYEPNNFGLYDMVGNVDELVEDCEHANYEGAPTDGSAWTTNCSKDMKMRRGGSYGSRDAARSTARGHTGAPNPSSMGEGIRVALALTAPAPPAPQSALLFEAELAKARVAEKARRKAAL